MIIAEHNKKVSPLEDGRQSILCLGGVQHDRVDFELLVKEFESKYQLVLAGKDISADPESDTWDDVLYEHYLGIAEQHQCVGAIGHSRGGKFVMDMLDRSKRLEFAAFINPPNSQASFNSLESKREYDTLTEKMLEPLVFDMIDDQYDEFISRHAQYERENGVIAPTLKPEFRRLKEEELLAKRIESYEGQSPILVIQAECDPWFREVNEKGQIRVCNIKNGGHCLHVSKAKEVAAEIRDWLSRVVAPILHHQVH